MTMQFTPISENSVPQAPLASVFPVSAWIPLRSEKKPTPLSKEQPHAAESAGSKPKRTSLQELSDFELIDLTIEGERAAFDVLVKRYNNSIYMLAYRIVRNHDDADDIAQEVFLKAFEALRSFRKKSSFHTWLYRITTNSCINFLRKHSAQRYIEFANYHVVREADTLDTLHKIELQEVVNEAIEKLPEKQRATVRLRVCEGLSHREVSRILKCSVGTAKANYFHAIRNLQRFMKNYIAANDDEEIVPAGMLRTGSSMSYFPAS